MPDSVSFNFSGLASGLDTQAIVDALIQVERVPVLRLQSRRATLNQQKSVLSNIDTRLDELLDRLRDLDRPSKLGSFTASSDDESVVQVGAEGNAQQGTYNITVSQLASSESNSSRGFADADTTDVGTGRIDITIDGEVTTIDLSSNPTNSLNDVRDAINDAGIGVTATVIDDGTAGTPYRLVLSSDETGTAGAYSVDFTNFTAQNGFDLSNNLQTAQDAQFSVNGLAVTRGSNSVDDVIDGVTFDLRSTGSAETTVSLDEDGVRGKVQGLVDALNGVLSQVDRQFQVDGEGQTSAVLFGDSALRKVGRELRSAFANAATGTGSVYDSLASIGIRTNSAGRFAIDSDDFEEALENDFEGVVGLLTDAENGVFQRLEGRIEELTDATDGLIKTRQDGITRRIDGIDDRITRLEDRLGRYEERLIARFAAFETAIGRLNAQGSALASFGI